MLWWASGKRTLNSINYGGLGRMVNNPNPINLKKLLKKQVVIELDGLNESDKCFVIGCIFNWIQEYRRSQPEREILKHVILVDEAHHIFRKKQDTKPEDITDQIFREVREYGEAFIIMDQHPHKTSVQALGNTDAKIALQMDLQKDRQAMAGSMLIDRQGEKWLGQQSIGTAIAKTGRTQKPFTINIPEFKITKGIATDNDLRRNSLISKKATPPTPEDVASSI